MDVPCSDPLRRWLAALAFAGLPLIASAQTPVDEARAQAARAAARIQALQKEADQLAEQARTVFGDLRKLELDRQIKIEDLARIEAKLVETTAARDAAATRSQTLEGARLANTPDIAARLVTIYKRGHGGYASLLFASDDLRAFGRLSRGVAAMAELDGVRFDAQRQTVTAGRAALADLTRETNALKAQQAEAQAARQALDAAVAARNRLIDDLDRRRDLAAQFVGELQAAQAALQQTVAGVVKAGNTVIPPLPLPAFRGDLDWPIAGPVVTAFGKATSGKFGTAVARNGIEIGANERAPARAVHEGTVAFAAPFTGFGTLVIVDHGGGAFSLYGHLSDAMVAKGDKVRRGTVVGAVGLSPAGSAALYFELRIDGRPVDPVQWLRRSG